MSSSMQRIILYIMENKSHVPNHQIKKKTQSMDSHSMAAVFL